MAGRPDADDGSRDDLHIAASCPHCGGANAWRLFQTLLRCSFCGSTLWWPRRPDRPAWLVAADAAATPEAQLDVLQTMDALAERARVAALRHAGASAPDGLILDPADDPTLPDLGEIKASRAHLFALEASHRLLAPYLLVSVTLVFHVLGRSRVRGGKEFRNLLFTGEEILPAYPAPWDFRDRGLWVARQRFRPFSAEDLAAAPLPFRDVDVDVQALTQRWRSQRLLVEPDLDPIAFDAEVAETSVWRVFRPFHYVRARTPDGTAWFLLDGQFGTVAGHPGDTEVARALARAWPAVDPAEAAGASPRAIGFRCPECASDVALDPRGAVQRCTFCGRLVEPAEDGLSVVPYRVVEPRAVPWWPEVGAASTVWVPFWRLRTEPALGSARFADADALLRALLPPAPAAIRGVPAPSELWLPAFDALAVSKYDAWAFEIAGAMSAAGVDPSDSRIGTDVALAENDRMLLPAIEWHVLAPAVARWVPELLPRPMQARLNPAVIAKLREVVWSREAPELVFVALPVVSSGGELRVLGPGSSVGWAPLREGRYPPDLERTIRRWLRKGRDLGRPDHGPVRGGEG